MRITFILLLIISIFGCNQDTFTQLTEEELIKAIVGNEMPPPEEMSIVDAEGNEITIDSLKILELTGIYFEDFYANSQKEIVQLVLRKKTAEDEIFLTKLNKELTKVYNAAPIVNTVEIDCDDKVNILQTAYDRDQGIRGGNSEIDHTIDHENLEIIVSFIEKCGMPTLAEVNHQQMAAILLVLQHAQPKYQSKYIPLLEKSAENGDIEWSAIALMKDRALMHNGEPQIYGSQVANGELYDLFEPEYVDQKSEGIGMEPLKDYLNRLGIEFNVEQKIKQIYR